MTQQNQKQPFPYGTVKRPVPLPNGAKLSLANVGLGQTGQLSPIPKSGFIARLRYEFSGVVDVTTLDATPYVVPLWGMLANYKLSNSLGYEYRSMSGDSFYFWNQVTSKGSSSNDRVTGSPTFRGIDATSAGAAKPFAFVLTDEVSLNDGLNFDKFLLSAQTLDNDLTIGMTYAADLTPLQNGGSGAARFANLQMNVQVTAEYYTVPDTNTFALPDTSLVQQVLDDTTNNNLLAGLNYINVLPIQGPEFLGIGLKITENGTPDPANALTHVQSVELRANGTDPIMKWTGTDLIQSSFETFGRALPPGWLYFDFTDDISLPNAMGPVERLVFSTQAYSQLQLAVQMDSATPTNGTSGVKVFKRLQSEVAA